MSISSLIELAERLWNANCNTGNDKKKLDPQAPQVRNAPNQISSQGDRHQPPTPLSTCHGRESAI
jgi:hypothetical protein